MGCAVCEVFEVLLGSPHSVVDLAALGCCSHSLYWTDVALAWETQRSVANSSVQVNLVVDLDETAAERQDYMDALVNLASVLG